ncbi:DUF2076 domain-containing protein [Marinivivus vitaminiproducens]|uniref:DUF2076 domain-containing protein n=1 Tax=Marinivivus vitaminiproducens TaxID=3035935 RepID=UPI0027A7DB28|nr:DUF2076 family protein [Geminicoccaceae bacterium SCSIO 64248]
MDQMAERAIDDLFARLRQAEAKLGPRDAEAEAAIGRHLARFPAAGYYLAQAVLAHEEALSLMHGRLRHSEERTVGGDLLATLTRGVPARPSPADRAADGGSGFLGNAGQTAVGIAASLALADILSETLGTSAADETQAIDDAFGMAEPDDDDGSTDAY